MLETFTTLDTGAVVTCHGTILQRFLVQTYLIILLVQSPCQKYRICPNRGEFFFSNTTS
jgi:hypothetical protein